MFTTVGTQSRFDCCKHLHETLDEAQKCLLEHQSEMRRKNKVSTRQIVETDDLDELFDEIEIL